MASQRQITLTCTIIGALGHYRNGTVSEHNTVLSPLRKRHAPELIYVATYTCRPGAVSVMAKKPMIFVVKTVYWPNAGLVLQILNGTNSIQPLLTGTGPIHHCSLGSGQRFSNSENCCGSENAKPPKFFWDMEGHRVNFR